MGHIPYEEGTKFLTESARTNENMQENNGFGNIIPVKLDFGIEGKRNELFYINRADPHFTYESLIKYLNENNEIPQGHEEQMIKSLKKQLNQFKTYKPIDGECIKIIKINFRIDNVVVTD